MESKAKEEAKRLVELFKEDENYSFELKYKYLRAIKCVEEIMKACPHEEVKIEEWVIGKMDMREYWQQVKKELELL